MKIKSGDYIKSKRTGQAKYVLGYFKNGGGCRAVLVSTGRHSDVWIPGDLASLHEVITEREAAEAGFPGAKNEDEK